MLKTSGPRPLCPSTPPPGHGPQAKLGRFMQALQRRVGLVIPASVAPQVRTVVATALTRNPSAARLAATARAPPPWLRAIQQLVARGG